MRSAWLVLSLAGAATAAPGVVRADPPAAPRPAVPVASQAAPPPASDEPDPALVYYPTAARSAGVEGQAVLRCSRNEHLALTGCVLVSEKPDGQGFGKAAMAMAAQSRDNPKIDMPAVKAAPPVETTIFFTLRPPTISPDITRVAHTFSNPTIVTEPTRAQILAAYPVRALADQLVGGAYIVCMVTETGKLSGCRVDRETPAGYGFGQAALDLATDYVLAPAKVDGEPVGGRQVRIGVAFSAVDPDAPLSLDTKPGK